MRYHKLTDEQVAEIRALRTAGVSGVRVAQQFGVSTALVSLITNGIRRTPYTPPTLGDRFWAKVDKSGECWVWTRARTTYGYGVLRVGERPNARNVGAHRISWELHNGPIPKGMEVCHRCDNPPCVNPAHLFLGSHFDNMADATDKGHMGRPPRA